MDAMVFEAQCRAIVENLGDDKTNHAWDHVGGGAYFKTDIRHAKCYEDDKIVIVAHARNKGMVVIRRENRNPVLWVQEDGTIPRVHGEMEKLRAHLVKLLSLVYRKAAQALKKLRDAQEVKMAFDKKYAPSQWD
jgi:hypothetical protein